MQKVINVLAVLSFLGTAGIVGGGTAVYLNKDSIAGQLPGMMDSAMPDVTSGPLPIGSMRLP